ncbi:RNA polymerase I-specific transcription initiation factor RRN6-like protein [Aspergillus coremiiformis]|uniref:RNA polymerase I-specific transcription initiation factor RRN6-like protein n=1 Tax=Aspergillus coremiiformis TaxID=138285 RepID=A0A5N6YTU7_9EURO|nr:RNA polymerase I-specific transcription initiation factor RRN6-like protein [Aspergillus coremiiformis]
MYEHPASALQYGHLGKAIYHPETQVWVFSRTFTLPPLITFTGARKTTITSPLTAPQSSQFENKSLVSKVYPELAACWPLANSETLSHVIATTSEICDPLVSSLLDLGHAADLENDDSGSRTVPIAVVAGGECGNGISLYKIDEDCVDLKLGTTSRVRVPSIREAENAEWSARAAPVRQICFARTVEEKPTWMAARFPHSTLVFRPLYHRRPVLTHICHETDQIPPSRPPNSRLDANPLVEILNSQTGGFEHAAVTFNPWYQKQIGIVDVRGNWSIWEISGRHKQNKGNWTAACANSGTLPWLDLGASHDTDAHPRHDGWAAIEWAGDVNSFIVSDRRCLVLYNMASGQVYPYSIELGLKKKSEWILDVKRSACNVSHIFILTTLRVFWLDVNPYTPKDGTRPSLFPRLSWRHFRDPEDTTLQLTPMPSHDSFYLVLFSKLSQIALTFYCPTISDRNGDMEPMPDPFVLDIPLMSQINAESQPSLTQPSSLVFKEIMHLPSTPGKKGYDPNIRLMKLFVLDSHLSVHELVYIKPLYNGTLHRQDMGKEVIRLKRRYPMMRGRQVHSARSYKDFIIDDCDESVIGFDTLSPPDNGMSSITPLVIPQWTIDYSQVYQVATGRLLVSQENDFRQMHEKGFLESFGDLENTISALSESLSAGLSLLEILGRSPLLDDIDQNAQDVEELLSNLSTGTTSTRQPQHLVFQLADHPRSPSTTSVKPAKLSEPGLIEIYDQSVDEWLAALSHSIPGRTRMMKEKIIRSMAADLLLAQVIVVRKMIYTSEKTSPVEQSSGQTEDTMSFSPNIDPKAESQKRSFLPSAILGGNGNSSRTIRDHETCPLNTRLLYSSLAGFTNFTGGGNRSVPQSVANMLHCWLPGMDPIAYNWQRTVQGLETEEPRRESKKTISQRWMRNKIVGSSANQVTSAAIAVRDWGSQPETNEPPVVRLESSQVIEDDLPMTQIERGTFGGRESCRKGIVKARKRKRAAGF